jgi:beta-hydroxylase
VLGACYAQCVIEWIHLAIGMHLRYFVIALFVSSTVAVHFRGRVRHAFFRKQLFDHSALFAPYNVLVYLFSKVPVRPFLEIERFPELSPLREHWRSIRDEALQLLDQGHVRTSPHHEDGGFNSFFKRGWKRFHLKWYGQPLDSARMLCPRTVEILAGIPSVKAAMFASLSPGGKLNPHRDPFAGSLRYHLGLVTPNSDACRIVVDACSYSWRDGEDVVFDETYIHEAENATDTVRIILFCDIERPLHTPMMRVLNRAMAFIIGRATAVRNMDGEPLGVVNRLFFVVHRAGELRKRIKRANKTTYKTLKWALAALVIVLLIKW